MGYSAQTTLYALISRLPETVNAEFNVGYRSYRLAFSSSQLCTINTWPNKSFILW